MQPTTPTKPVMDVAAPRGPVPASAPAPASMPPSQPEPAISAPPKPQNGGDLPVRPAPFSQPPTQLASSPTVAARRPSGQKTTAAALPQNRTPVALITVTIFVMLVLSALAVTVYVTSQTA